jgi:predicted ATP-dependent protease
MTSEHEQWRLTPEQTRKECDPARFTIATTETPTDLRKQVWQRRARDAIAFALELGGEGYHLYVSGEPGSGRLATALEQVRLKASTGPAASDWIYAHNFERPSEPLAIDLPAGGGPVFARQVDDVVATCRRELRRAFSGAAYRRQRATLLEDIGAQHERLVAQLQQKGLSHGFLVQPTPEGLVMVALKRAAPSSQEDADRGGRGTATPSPGFEPLSPQEYAALSEAEQERLRGERALVSEAITSMLPQLETLDEEARTRMRELDQRLAQRVIKRSAEELSTLYHEQPRIVDFLQRMADDLSAHADILAQFSGDEPPNRDESLSPERPIAAEDSNLENGDDAIARVDRTNGLSEGERGERSALAALLRRYRINVLVTRPAGSHAPVVHELNPTYANLVGRIEFGLREGLPFTDHLLIRPGALHLANGGYLLLQARDLLSQPRAWEALIRTLRFGLIGVESDGEQPSMPASAALRPEPIPARLQAILVGEPDIFAALALLDPEFAELFAVRADLEPDAPRTEENERFYSEFANQVRQSASLPGFAPAAVALLVEEGSRWAADQERLSADLRSLRRLIVEAGQVAQAAAAQTTCRGHVASAITARERRMSLVSDRLDDLIDQRVIMVDTDGAVVGQVNGLTVMSTAGYAFGKPARITARTAPGRAGIVNLERETAMSGPAHSKGILILTGYLAGRFASGYPLSLTGSICFEQIYGEIEGDSASSAELYALLSSLSGVAITQSLAVTGSVNQRGEIQPVGAVTEKVEGFYHVCARRGLTGEQGVIIPRANMRNLMLREEVVEAIRAGRFHIYAVETADQGMELLTGKPAGHEDAQGAFAEGTVNELVGRTLRRYAELMRGF